MTTSTKIVGKKCLLGICSTHVPTHVQLNLPIINNCPFAEAGTTVFACRFFIYKEKHKSEVKKEIKSKPFLDLKKIKRFNCVRFIYLCVYASCIL